MPLNSIAAAVIGVSACLITAFVAAAQPSGTGTNIQSAIYQPVTGDLMNAVIQPRHVKLWLAGKSHNWAYAEYERHNIGGALGRMAAAIPLYKGVAMSTLIASFATPGLARLEAAIEAKDEAAFAAAYDRLTAGCNQCHAVTGHSVVLIQTPNANPFPDQSFVP